jgi:magnesium transporter
MITTFLWTCSDRTCGQLAAEQIPASAADLASDDVLWIDLADPTPDEERFVFERFLPVHRLTLEDISRPRREADQAAHLPKVEEFPDYLFIIVNPLARWPAAGPDGVMEEPRPAAGSGRRDRGDRCQLSAVLTNNILVTHHYQPLACVDEVLAYISRHGETTGRGPDYLFHLVLDAMVDDYAPVVDRVSNRLDRLEARVFRDPSPEVLREMLRVKRRVVGMRKTLILEREVLARLTRGEFDLVTEREVVYYRNVYDHLVRYTELIESAREMVGDLMQTHLSAASNRLNEIMKVLTMISTVILPMTLVAGVYGMNFEQNVWPDLKSSWGFAFSLGLMALTGVGALAFFRWKRWL